MDRRDRLSSPLNELPVEAGVVVVGSGYGGAVMACRLARAGQDVVLLERGKERHPGEYPSGSLHAALATQVRTAWGRVGSSTGMFDIRLARGQSVLVGCGLGGTSLINANVALRAGERTFDERWPSAFDGKGQEVLGPFYERAERMLGSRPFPEEWGDLRKVDALGVAGAALGKPIEMVPINVTFGAGPNAVGVHQEACTLCGDCCTGCNVGAKNTVLANYLPDAHAHGARIFTELEVRQVRRSHGRWLVDVVPVGRGRDRFPGPPLVIAADVVVLAAGTLGSTEILLRSREAGLEVSDRLGQHFSGNGDVLGFAYDTFEPVDAVGWGARRQRWDVGPTIASRIPWFSADGSDVTIEEGAIPGALRSFIAPISVVATLARRDLRIGRRVRLALSAARHAARHTLTFLVMSRDDGDGRLRLGRRGLAVDWEDVGTGPLVASNNRDLRKAAESLGGSYLAQPMWTKEAGYNLLTVHPLGGCIMADRSEEGAVDDRGRVFSGATGTAVHDGLLVADGSILPSPVDLNPLLTISALSERAADLLMEDRGWEPGPDAVAAPTAVDRRPEPAERPHPSTLSFTERLVGWVSPPGEGFTLAPAWTKRPRGSSRFEMVGTVIASDLDAVLADPATPMAMVGTVQAPSLSPHPLTISGGELRLLERVPTEVETWHMRYSMDLVTPEGDRYHVEAIKVLRDDAVWHFWRAGTTAYVTVTRGQLPGGETVAVGRIAIRLEDLARMVASIRVDGSHGSGAFGRLRFLRSFLGRAYAIYGGLLGERDLLASMTTTAALPEGARPLRLPPAEVRWRTGDGTWQEGRPGPGARAMLTRYRGGAKGPVLLAPGFSMAARCYASPATSTNLAEYLVEHGYDVWLTDPRSSIDLECCHEPATLDPLALEDWPAAVDEVRARTGARSVLAFGHCVGSSSLLMALAAGMVGVRAAVCSQMTLHVRTSLFNRVKCGVRIPELAHAIGMSGASTESRSRLRDLAGDLVYHVVPMPPREHCGQESCRFVNTIYGCTHTHDQLDDASHQGLDGEFGYGNSAALRHLARIVRRGGEIVDADGRPRYTSNPERLDLPIHFLIGRRNYLFRPEGSFDTIAWLRAHNDPDLYSYDELEDYAHVDSLLGPRAVDDVYPLILDALERHPAPDRPIPA